jgi:hypothetical protein
LTEFGAETLLDDPIKLAAVRIRTLPDADQEQFVRAIRSLALEEGREEID